MVITTGDLDPTPTPLPPLWSTRARPTPLDAAEERLPDVAALARRFNPAMAFPSPDVWPVEVRYAWSEGANLIAHVAGASGKPARSYVAVPNAELERRPWADLPTRDGAGRAIRYTIDAPGDDVVEHGRSRWRRRFTALTRKALAAPASAAAPFPPTQYAHLFWYNRAEGLLGIQYWFFYPFNEWVNHHEGDWEHVNVILQGPSALTAGVAAAYRPRGYQFFFHRWRHDTEEVIRFSEGDGDHVLVYAGGRARFLWWSGMQSGASYPLPAVYPGSSLGPDEDTRAPARFIAARDFQVIVLPEPERLNAVAHPELSWLRLPFYVGQEWVQTNPPLLEWLGGHGPPLQPAHRSAWNATTAKPPWGRRPLSPSLEMLRVPNGWALLASPLPKPSRH